MPKLSKPLSVEDKSPNGIPILRYHKISPDSEKGGFGLRVTPSDFDWEMHYLKDSGYHSVGIDDVVAHYKNGKNLPEKPLVITFDDGYKDNYQYAYPILKKYGFTATIFVATKTVGGINEFDYLAKIQPKKKMLSWNEIKEMDKNGITIGAHTIDHPHLTQIGRTEALHQISGSKKILEKELNKEVKYFSYPYGDYDLAVAGMAKNSGYLAAVTSDQGLVRSPVDQYRLKRIGITGYLTHQSFVQVLQGNQRIIR